MSVAVGSVHRHQFRRCDVRRCAVKLTDKFGEWQWGQLEEPVEPSPDDPTPRRRVLDGAIDDKGSIFEHNRAMAVAVLYPTIRALGEDDEMLPEPKCGL